jgi:serine/threonine-protein kinase HipA
MRIAVELYGTKVGTLEGDPRTFDFTPSGGGIDRFGMNSRVLSVAIPLAGILPRHHAARRRNWFTELLPEGDQYDYMLAQGGLARGDTLAFLARYGRDVAGALQLWDLDDPAEPRAPGLRHLRSEDVRTLLEDPIGSPLANAPESGKSSLGGVQPKIVLVKTAEGWAQALGGHPTTHILKPALGGAKHTLICDEEYGLRLAQAIGLADFSVSISDFAGLAALVIERYDRSGGNRIHQEDLSQVLGASGNEKYQELGGVVSLRRVAEALRRHTSAEDLHRLARMVVFAVAIGNLDLHTKNLGLLHPVDGEVRLAPAYDIVPQVHQHNDGRLALSVNGKYRHAAITQGDLRAEFAEWGIRRASPIVEETLLLLQSVVQEEVPQNGAYPELREAISAFIDNLLHGRPVGGRP